ncbi:MAG: GTPase HflX [Clostridia bacterium]|nr:GTPase HflX [Clostridia bacterium]MBQ8512413.1 GTPase HflX [Clostridia bacterium]
MEQNNINNENKLKAILCAIHKQGGEQECMISLGELERLCETADCECVGIVTQNRETPDVRSVLGSGKIAELSGLCDSLAADLVIFDCELSPSQIKAIEDDIERDVSVIDRSMLILDIFADHARTSEGRLQVELAQLRYTSPRLVGRGKELSRQGGTASSGSVGARGPGETKLEIDRRRVKEKIAALEEELRKVEQNRMVMRRQRDKSGITKCGIVGYTNAGKSTLLNYLTGAGILAENKLFATLDPTTRQFTTPNGTKLLLTDTVGFIRNLPHHLIKAFKSTLDEAVYSDILLIVIDSSDPEFITQTQVTTELLEELGASGKPTIYVFNKCDACTDRDALIHMKSLGAQTNTEVVFISAITGAGCDALVERIEAMAANGKHRIAVMIPPEDGAVTGIIYKEADDVDMDYREDGIFCRCVVDDRLYAKLKKYIVEED